MNDEEGGNRLLGDGETIEQWWEKNGLNVEQARLKRKATYLQQLKDAAIAMDKYNANTTSNKN